MRLKPRTVIMIASPGKIMRWGAVKILIAFLGQHRAPFGSRGTAPSPRNPRAAASRITVAMPSVPRTTSGVSALGTTLVTSTFHREAPRA